MLKFPRKQKGEKGKEMEGKRKEWKERRREKIRNRMGRYIGTGEGIVSEEAKVLSLLPGRKNFY